MRYIYDSILPSHKKKVNIGFRCHRKSLYEKPIPPWLDNFDKCLVCKVELNFLSYCQKLCSDCYIIYIRCRYCLTINIIFWLSDQLQCRKCSIVSLIEINEFFLSIGSIDSFNVNNNTCIDYFDVSNDIDSFNVSNDIDSFNVNNNIDYFNFSNYIDYFNVNIDYFNINNNNIDYFNPSDVSMDLTATRLIPFRLTNFNTRYRYCSTINRLSLCKMCLRIISNIRNKFFRSNIKKKKIYFNLSEVNTVNSL